MGRTRRRATLLGLAALGWAGIGGVLFVGVPAAASPRASVGRPTAAWWSASNVGHGLPALPTSPDVKGHQLLVQGSNAAPSNRSLSTAPTTSQAVAAIRWTIPAGHTVASVRLGIAGTAPSQLSVQACRVTGSFHPEYGGPYSDVPANDCNRPVDATLKGSDLVFSGVQSLARGRVLDLLIRPGPLDRVMLEPPSPSSLRLATATPGGPAGPPAGGPSPPPATAPGGGSMGNGTGAGTVGGGTGGLTTSGGASGGSPPTLAGSGTGPAAGQAPQVAGSNPGAPRSGATPAAARLLPPAGWRRLVAGLIVAAEVLIFAALHVRRRDRAADPDQPRGRGVGRFVRERTGRPVAL